MGFLKRPLSEKEIEACRRAAVKALEGIVVLKNKLSMVKRGEEWRKGEGRLVFQIGYVTTSGRKTPFVIKLYLPPIKRDDSFVDTHHLLSSTPTSLNEELNAAWFRKKGFPVPVHHAVGEVAPRLIGTITENLAAGGENCMKRMASTFQAWKTARSCKGNSPLLSESSGRCASGAWLK